jgi:hypothetical protein
MGMNIFFVFVYLLLHWGFAVVYLAGKADLLTHPIRLLLQMSTYYEACNARATEHGPWLLLSLGTRVRTVVSSFAVQGCHRSTELSLFYSPTSAGPKEQTTVVAHCGALLSLFLLGYFEDEYSLFMAAVTLHDVLVELAVAHRFARIH